MEKRSKWGVLGVAIAIVMGTRILAGPLEPTDPVYTQLTDFDGLGDFVGGTVTTTGTAVAEIAAIGNGDSSSFHFDATNAADFAYGDVAVNYGGIGYAEYNALPFAIQFDYRLVDSIGTGTTTLVNPTEGTILRLDSLFEIYVKHGTRVRTGSTTYGLLFTSPVEPQPDLNVGVVDSENGQFASDDWTRFQLFHTGEIDPVDGYSIWKVYAGTPGSDLAYYGIFGGRALNSGTAPTVWRLGNNINTRSLGFIDNFTVFYVPEPSAVLLATLGVCSLAVRRRSLGGRRG